MLNPRGFVARLSPSNPGKHQEFLKRCDVPRPPKRRLAFQLRPIQSAHVLDGVQSFLLKRPLSTCFAVSPMMRLLRYRPLPLLT